MSDDVLYQKIKTFLDMATPENAPSLKAKVKRCPRCQDFHERVGFRGGYEQVGGWTHVGYCPTTGRPILLSRTAGKSARLG